MAASYFTIMKKQTPVAQIKPDIGVKPVKSTYAEIATQKPIQRLAIIKKDVQMNGKDPKDNLLTKLDLDIDANQKLFDDNDFTSENDLQEMIDFYFGYLTHIKKRHIEVVEEVERVRLLKKANLQNQIDQLKFTRAELVVSRDNIKREYEAGPDKLNAANQKALESLLNFREISLEPCEDITVFKPELKLKK